MLILYFVVPILWIASLKVRNGISLLVTSIILLIGGIVFLILSVDAVMTIARWGGGLDADISAFMIMTIGYLIMAATGLAFSAVFIKEKSKGKIKSSGVRHTSALESTFSASPQSRKESKYDLMILRNGDNLSGTILNESFTIQTTYTTLSFPKDEIKRMLFESAQADIQIMELLRGDILQGVIQDEIINIDIPSAGKTPIEQDKIREINFAKKQTTD